MPTRPTWSGSIQISLVSIAVRIFPATNPGKQIEFHQIDRKTHKRVHHQNVDEAGEVGNRFEAAELPAWENDSSFQQLLLSFESILPLRLPSEFRDPKIHQRILSLSEGVL